MCKFQNIKKGVMICEYTKQICTICIMGKGKTYQEAEKSEEANK